MIAAWLLLGGCPGGEPAADTAAAEPVVEFEALPAPRLLRRMSLDLRGTLPTVEELDAVEADPAQLEVLAAGFFDAETADDRLVSLLAERWHTVLDNYEVDAEDYALPEDQNDAFAHAVGEEPLRLISKVIREDLPWSEIVLADYTMANETLASVWPLEYPAEGTGWQEARYTDGRPAAGVLGTNGFYWRYVTNISNKNRGRVAAVSRLLLCTDLLGRPVEFERGASLDPEEAIRTEPACVTCHATVDPIAASFFGYWWTIQYNTYEMQTYHPERERLGPELLSTSPAWYGIPTGGLTDIGWYIAADPRFNRCAGQSFAEQLWQRPTGLADYAALEGMRQRFEAQGLHPQALILEVLQTEEYRAGDFTPEASDATRAKARVRRLISPNQQRLVLADFAGLHWASEGYTVLENDVLGLRALGGGVDGYSVTSPQASPGLTWVLVNARTAQAAASTLVAVEFDDAGAGEITAALEDRPGSEAFTAALERLHWRLYGMRADAEWTPAIAALWTSVEATDGAAAAWEAVVEAMLRDPLFVSY